MGTVGECAYELSAPLGFSEEQSELNHVGMLSSIFQSMELSETVSRSFAGQQEQQQQTSENSRAAIAASRGFGLDKVAHVGASE